MLISATLENSTNAGLERICVYIVQALVSWRFNLQSTITLFTTEAEYMAMTETMKEAIWLQGLLDDLGIDHDLLKINCDSMSDIYLVKIPSLSCKNEAH